MASSASWGSPVLRVGFGLKTKIGDWSQSTARRKTRFTTHAAITPRVRAGSPNVILGGQLSSLPPALQHVIQQLLSGLGSCLPDLHVLQCPHQLLMLLINCGRLCACMSSKTGVRLCRLATAGVKGLC